MPTPDEFPTLSSHPDFAIGIGLHVVKVGDSIRKEIMWEVPQVEDGLETCGWEPADFSGYTPDAAVYDISGSKVVSMSVSPTAGDDSGKFEVSLDSSETTSALKASARFWGLHINAGAERTTLVYAPFRLS